MDPVRNPYAPGAASARPSWPVATSKLAAFDVTLKRVANSRPERSVVLTGLRGVGKTVLLNALRSAAVRARLGDGQARGAALTSRCVARWRRRCTWRSRAGAGPRAFGDEVLGTVKAFACPGCRYGGRIGIGGNPGIDVPATAGRADSGDMEIDLVELLTDIGGLAADLGRGVAIFVDEMQDLRPEDVSALCAACHGSRRTGCRSSSSARDSRTCRRCI